MSYAKFDPDKSDILIQSIKTNGNITALSSHYNVSRETIYEYFKRDPHGKSIVHTVRGYNTELDLDIAENVFRYNMNNIKSNAGLAQRAAEKVIEGKGYSRGWGVQSTQEAVPLQNELNKDDIITRQQVEIAILKQAIKKNDNG